MVAIVTGNCLGLSNSSAVVLGDPGLFGKAALGNGYDRVCLNAATGNLVVQGCAGHWRKVSV